MAEKGKKPSRTLKQIANVVPLASLIGAQKATSIGPPGIGTRIQPYASENVLDRLARFFLGDIRPQSVAAQDPYGIAAWERGAGQAPIMAATIGDDVMRRVSGLRQMYPDETEKQLLRRLKGMLEFELSTPKTKANVERSELLKSQHRNVTSRQSLSAVEPLATETMYHGSPQQLSELQPGSMMTDDPAWAAGYATQMRGGIGPEEFVGKVHAANMPVPQRSLMATSLHDAEKQLIDLARRSLQREPKTLREAADIVRERYGYEAIVAKKADGTVTGIIPLRAVPVAEHLEPLQVVKTAMATGQPVAENVQDIVKGLAKKFGIGLPFAGLLAQSLRSQYPQTPKQ